jgi:hypothetical protein
MYIHLGRQQDVPPGAGNQSLACLLPRRRAVDPGPLDVGCEVDKVKFVEYFGFCLSVSFYQCSVPNPISTYNKDKRVKAENLQTKH